MKMKAIRKTNKKYKRQLIINRYSKKNLISLYYKLKSFMKVAKFFKINYSTISLLFKELNISPIERISKEQRVCACGCKNKFICYIKSKQKFLTNHFVGGYKFPKNNIPWNKGLTYKTNFLMRKSRKALLKTLKIQRKTGILRERQNRMRLKYLKGLVKIKINLPSRPEKFLMDFIKYNKLPYKYVGNRKFWVGGKNPDFKHKTKPILVEVFGCRWHGCPKHFPKLPNDLVLRKNHFKKYGFTTIFIWEHNLNKNNQLNLLKRLL